MHEIHSASIGLLCVNLMVEPLTPNKNKGRALNQDYPPGNDHVSHRKGNAGKSIVSKVPTGRGYIPKI